MALKNLQGMPYHTVRPKGWREVSVAVIPKAGKINHCSTKDQGVSHISPAVEHCL